jgi:hypothetical protein
MNIGNNPPLPQRAQLTSVAYALNAARADTAQVALAANRLDAPDGIPTNAVFVDKDGRVGIGTTGPATKLHLVRSDSAVALRISSTGQFGNAAVLQVEQGGDGWNIGTGALDLGGQNALGFRPLRNNNTRDETKMVITKDGNVGIGTTIPKEKLDVQGNMAISGTVNGINVKNHVHNLEYGFSQSNVLQSSSNLSFADTDASVTINADGASAYLVQVSCAVGQSLTDRLVTVGIFRGETLLHDARQRVQFPEPLVNESVSLLHVDVPPAGPQVYKIRFRPSNDGIGYITDKRLVVMKLKTTAP